MEDYVNKGVNDTLNVNKDLTKVLVNLFRSARISTEESSSKLDDNSSTGSQRNGPVHHSTIQRPTSKAPNANYAKSDQDHEMKDASDASTPSEPSKNERPKLPVQCSSRQTEQECPPL